MSTEGPAFGSGDLALMRLLQIVSPALPIGAFAYSQGLEQTVAEGWVTDEAEAAALQEQWQARGIDVPLVLLDSPYREVTRPLLEYIRGRRGQSPRDVVTVFIPEYVVGHWWEQLLHNQSALRLKARLLFEPGVMVTSVPWQLHSTDRLQAESTNTPE